MGQKHFPKKSLLATLTDKIVGHEAPGFDTSLVEAIKTDHRDLKAMYKILKDEDATMTEKKKVFKDFSSLLSSHSEAEEKTAYVFGTKVKDLKDSSFEGFEEHAVAAGLIEKIKATRTENQWKARVKVLAELVEHHIEEEEREFLPELEKYMKDQREERLLKQFMSLRKKSQPTIHADNAGILGEATALM